MEGAEKQRGGHRAGAGRHKADCTCEKCNLRRDMEKIASDEEKQIKAEEGNQQPAPDQQQQQQQSQQQQSTSNDNKDSNSTDTGKPADDKTGAANANTDANAGGKSKINFDRYKSVKNADANKGAQTQPKVKKGAAPQQEQIVVISGTVLLAIMNFITPHLFAYIAKFLKQDFVSDDFRLDKAAYKDLIPAADEVAKKWFRNMSPELQLMIGYAAISWTSAQLKRSLRKKS